MKANRTWIDCVWYGMLPPLLLWIALPRKTSPTIKFDVCDYCKERSFLLAVHTIRLALVCSFACTMLLRRHGISENPWFSFWVKLKINAVYPSHRQGLLSCVDSTLPFSEKVIRQGQREARPSQKAITQANIST